MISITISIPTKMKTQLERLSKKEQQNKSEIVRDALRQYFKRKEFSELREKMVPHAQKMGVYTDDDVFKLIS